MSKAAQKALRLVEAVARSAGEGLGSTAAADVAGLDKTTVSRLMSMLEKEDWVSRDPGNRRYFPGRRLWEIAYATGRSERISPDIDEVLVALQQSTGETVAMHQLVGRARLCIASHESAQEIRAIVQPGLTAPLHFGASSHVMLAFCAESLRREVLADLPDEAAREQLRAALTEITEHGYGSVWSAPDQSGSNALAVPLFAENRIYGSVVVLGPATRFTAARVKAAQDALLQAGRKISAMLRDQTPFYERWTAGLSSR